MPGARKAQSHPTQACSHVTRKWTPWFCAAGEAATASGPYPDQHPPPLLSATHRQNKNLKSS